MRYVGRWLALCAVVALLKEISSELQEDEIKQEHLTTEPKQVSKTYSCHQCTDPYYTALRNAFRFKGRPQCCPNNPSYGNLARLYPGCRGRNTNTSPCVRACPMLDVVGGNEEQSVTNNDGLPENHKQTYSPDQYVSQNTPIPNEQGAATASDSRFNNFENPFGSPSAGYAYKPNSGIEFPLFGTGSGSNSGVVANGDQDQSNGQVNPSMVYVDTNRNLNALQIPQGQETDTIHNAQDLPFDNVSTGLQSTHIGHDVSKSIPTSHAYTQEQQRLPSAPITSIDDGYNTMINQNSFSGTDQDASYRNTNIHFNVQKNENQTPTQGGEVQTSHTTHQTPGHLGISNAGSNGDILSTGGRSNTLDQGKSSQTMYTPNFRTQDYSYHSIHQNQNQDINRYPTTQSRIIENPNGGSSQNTMYFSPLKTGGDQLVHLQSQSFGQETANNNVYSSHQTDSQDNPNNASPQGTIYYTHNTMDRDQLVHLPSQSFGQETANNNVYSSHQTDSQDNPNNASPQGTIYYTHNTMDRDQLVHLPSQSFGQETANNNVYSSHQTDSQDNPNNASPQGTIYYTHNTMDRDQLVHLPSQSFGQETANNNVYSSHQTDSQDNPNNASPQGTIYYTHNTMDRDQLVHLPSQSFGQETANTNVSPLEGIGKYLPQYSGSLSTIDRTTQQAIHQPTNVKLYGQSLNGETMHSVGRENDAATTKGSSTPVNVFTAANGNTNLGYGEIGSVSESGSSISAGQDNSDNYSNLYFNYPNTVNGQTGYKHELSSNDRSVPEYVSDSQQSNMYGYRYENTSPLLVGPASPSYDKLFIKGNQNPTNILGGNVNIGNGGHSISQTYSVDGPRGEFSQQNIFDASGISGDTQLGYIKPQSHSLEGTNNNGQFITQTGGFDSPNGGVIGKVIEEPMNTVRQENNADISEGNNSPTDVLTTLQDRSTANDKTNFGFGVSGSVSQPGSYTLAGQDDSASNNNLFLKYPNTGHVQTGYEHELRSNDRSVPKYVSDSQQSRIYGYRYGKDSPLLVGSASPSYDKLFNKGNQNPTNILGGNVNIGNGGHSISQTYSSVDGPRGEFSQQNIFDASGISGDTQLGYIKPQSHSFGGTNNNRQFITQTGGFDSPNGGVIGKVIEEPMNTVRQENNAYISEGSNSPTDVLTTLKDRSTANDKTNFGYGVSGSVSQPGSYTLAGQDDSASNNNLFLKYPNTGHVQTGYEHELRSNDRSVPKYVSDSQQSRIYGYRYGKDSPLLVGPASPSYDKLFIKGNQNPTNILGGNVNIGNGGHSISQTYSVDGPRGEFSQQNIFDASGISGDTQLGYIKPQSHSLEGTNNNGQFKTQTGGFDSPNGGVIGKVIEEPMNTVRQENNAYISEGSNSPTDVLTTLKDRSTANDKTNFGYGVSGSVTQSGSYTLAGQEDFARNNNLFLKYPNTGHVQTGYKHELRSNDRSAAKYVPNPQQSSVYGYRYGSNSPFIVGPASPSYDKLFRKETPSSTPFKNGFDTGNPLDETYPQTSDSSISTSIGRNGNGNGIPEDQSQSSSTLTDNSQRELYTDERKLDPNKTQDSQNKSKDIPATGSGVAATYGKQEISSSHGRMPNTSPDNNDKVVTINGYSMKESQLKEIIDSFKHPDKCTLILPKVCSGPLDRYLHLIKSYPTSVNVHDGVIHMPSDVIVPLSCYKSIANVYAKDSPLFSDKSGEVLPSGHFVDYSTASNILASEHTPEKVMIVTAQGIVVPYSVYSKYIQSISPIDKKTLKVIIPNEQDPCSYEAYKEFLDLYAPEKTTDKKSKDTITLLGSNIKMYLETFLSILENYKNIKDATVTLPSHKTVSFSSFLKIAELLGENYTQKCIVNVPNTDTRIPYATLKDMCETYMEKKPIDLTKDTDVNFLFPKAKNPDAEEFEGGDNPFFQPSEEEAYPKYSHGGHGYGHHGHHYHPRSKYFLTEAADSVDPYSACGYSSDYPHPPATAPSSGSLLDVLHPGHTELAGYCPHYGDYCKIRHQKASKRASA